VDEKLITEHIMRVRRDALEEPCVIPVHQRLPPVTIDESIGFHGPPGTPTPRWIRIALCGNGLLIGEILLLLMHFVGVVHLLGAHI
jgi:hypothetical protein